VKLREEEFYEQYHQHGGTTIIPTEIFNELYDDATEEIERLNKTLDTATEIINNKHKEIERLNNIINTILDFGFFKEECPLNFGYQEECDEERAQEVFYEDDYCEETCNDDYKKCWLKYFKRLQELKGSDKE